MNYFELFGLTAQFPIDQLHLSSQYRQLQKQLHPDNFVNASERDYLLSVQKAAEINDAYHILKNDISRAEYLIDLMGIQRTPEATFNDPMFLMQQMEWREQLEDIAQNDDMESALFDFEQTIQQDKKQLFSELTQCLAEQQGENALAVVNKLKFMQKLLGEIEQLEDRLLG